MIEDNLEAQYNWMKILCLSGAFSLVNVHIKNCLYLNAAPQI